MSVSCQPPSQVLGQHKLNLIHPEVQTETVHLIQIAVIYVYKLQIHKIWGVEPLGF